MEMSQKPVLAVFGMDQIVRDYLKTSIQESIGNLVEVVGYAMDTPYTAPLWADLVVSSGAYTYPIAKRVFPGCPVIEASRVVSMQNLERVLMLPRGTRALVVTHPRMVSEATIQSLRDFGINHLVYEPFWLEKRCDPSQIDVIITPGLLHWCPPELDVPIIDIGTRRIAIETLAKILEFFHFDMSYLRSFEQQYLRQYVQASQRLRLALERSEALRRRQSVILHEIDEGILATDQKGDVVVSNPTIQRLFGPVSRLQENDELRGILSRLDAAATERDESSDSVRSDALLVKYRGNSIYCWKNIITLDDEVNTFYTFKAVAQIEALGYSVRRKIRNRGFTAHHTFEDIRGGCPALQEAKERARRFAGTDETILITGESGTGKELFAQAIHNASPRAGRPFVAVNLAAVPESLLESELFGYQEGAFTGAKKGGKQGVFELAHGGTLFLDEIGDAPLHIQLLLLRVLEVREVTRVGGEETIPVDVRVVAATNVSLEEAIRQGRFRADLYYRLNVLPVRTVPLREMREEVPKFARDYLMERFGARRDFTPEAMERLKRWPWRGNFREFNNAMDYIYYTTQGRGAVTVRDFPAQIAEAEGPEETPGEALTASADLRAVLAAFAARAPEALGRRAVREALAAGGRPVPEAALKRLIGELGRLGLVQVGVTRQGTCVTRAGLEAHRAMAGEKG